MKILDVFIQHAKSSLNKPFSYLYDGDQPIGVGYRVIVGFGRQNRLMGFVARVSETNLTQKELEEANGFRFDYIQSVVDREPLLNDELLQLADEVSKYYIAPKISVFQAMLPQSLKPSISALKGPKIAYEDYVEAIDVDEEGLTDKQIESLRLIAKSEIILKREAGTPAIVKALLKKEKIRIVKREKQRLHLEEYEKERPHDLNLEQLRAYEDILGAEQDVVLLQGVTGSGKTEVYLHLSEEYLKTGKNILMLVPEISLTPRMVEYFSRRFQSNVAILHSELTPAEKYDEYRRIAKGEARVVVGARSAVFAPLKDIGLIILDEEHVESYKQDGQPHYHAREVAIMRAKHFGAKVLLGSATPSFETKARAMKGVYGYALMQKRANSQAPPTTEIIDLTDKSLIDRQTKIFSRPLLEKLDEKVKKGEQAILLINRRGYSSYVACSRCGYIFTCPGCHGNLTYHKEDGMLKCHHCG
ncbi:MAG: primosomal protein N', partial [Bacilli bacterium]|nr:primosomal protein N' [Bacilli bacterium]